MIKLTFEKENYSHIYIKIKMLIKIILMLLLPQLLIAQKNNVNIETGAWKEMRIPANGIELQVKHSPNNGETIIFLHSGGSNLMMWQRVIPFFKDNYNIILVDMRGHGKSDKPLTGNNIDVMAKDIASMMDYLKLKSIHIIGSSLGAEVGLSLAASYPAKVKSLICEGALYSEYGPYGVWSGSEEEFKKSIPPRIEGAVEFYCRVFNSSGEMIDQNKKALEQNGWWNEYFKALTEYNVYKTPQGKYSGSWQDYAVKEYCGYYFNYKFEDYYKRVQCPVLMLAGEEHLANEKIKNAMYGLSKLVKKCKVIETPDWIHPYGWMLNPDKMCKTILDFLRN